MLVARSFAECLAWAVTLFSDSSETPRLDAELLLEHVTGLSRLRFIVDPQQKLLAPQAELFEQLVTRRSRGEPVAYLIGKKEFFGREFFVTPAVLIPRPETEILVEEALLWIRSQNVTRLPILDLGTGSGCIAVTLACECHALGVDPIVVALDRSSEALAVAHANARRHGVARQIHLLNASWTEALSPRHARFPLIVSNPPYIEEGSPEVSPATRYEPQAALYSGVDGLAAIQELVRAIPDFLSMPGLFLCEIGHRHAPVLRAAHAAHFAALGLTLQFRFDHSGVEHILLMKKGDNSIRPSFSFDTEEL